MEKFLYFVDIATLLLVAILSVAALVFRSAVRAGAEEGAKKIIKKINWAEELRQELEKARGIERQELRLKSYGKLWSCLRPLAIYSSETLDKAAIAHLSGELSDWYFSECGGMMMTTTVREFYFALQDLAQAVTSSRDNWQCQRVYECHRTTFVTILDEMNLDGARRVCDKMENVSITRWSEFTLKELREWKTDVATIGRRWNELDETQKFVVLQQVSSFLRSALTYDVESRLR